MGHRWRHRDGRPVRLPLLVALLVLASACGGAAPEPQVEPTPEAAETTTTTPAAAPGEPRYGGDLVFARREDNSHLDPIPLIQFESIKLVNHIFETLYVTSPDGLSTVPWLATDHEVSDDQLTWTFRLREGVRFSNGEPLTSEDVKFSIDRGREEAAFAFLYAAIDTIEAPDPGTVVIRTSHPWAPLLADLAAWPAVVYPKDFGGMTPEEFFENPVGTGPFVLDEWVRGSHVRLVRNPDYWQEGKPYLDSVTWGQVPDANTRVLQLEGGQSHIISEVPLNQMESLQARGGVTAQSFPGTTVWYIMFNTTVPPLDDVHVRRAIAHAVDTEAIAEAFTFGFGGAACSIIAPTVPFHDPDTPCLEHDLDRAREELAQSSVPDGFATELLVGDDPLQVSIAEAVQAQLAPLGIEVSLRLIDPGQFYETLSSFDYEMGVAGWTMDISDPDEQVAFMLDPEEGGGDSYSTGYDNPEMTELVRAGQRAFSDDERQEIYARIQAIHAAEVPHLPILFVEQTFGWREEVKGFFVNPVGDRHLEDVWLDQP